LVRWLLVVELQYSNEHSIVSKFVRGMNIWYRLHAGKFEREISICCFDTKIVSDASCVYKLFTIIFFIVVSFDMTETLKKAVETLCLLIILMLSMSSSSQKLSDCEFNFTYSGQHVVYNFKR